MVLSWCAFLWSKADDGILVVVGSRGVGDVNKRQVVVILVFFFKQKTAYEI
mgnify:CR=1 FL=1